MRSFRLGLVLLVAASPLLAQQSAPSTPQLEGIPALPGVLRESTHDGGLPPMSSSVAGKVNIRLGDLRTVRIVPGQRFELPLVIDPAGAGGANVASMTAAITWDAARISLDSVTAGTFGTLTFNANNAATGSLSVSVISPAGTTAAVTVARLFFKAAVTNGGTTVVLAPTALGNQSATNLLASAFARHTQACVAPTGKWGDVNGDGSTNIIDAQQIARASVQLSVARPELVAAQGDVTADNEVNILDAQQIARNAVGLDAAPRVGVEAFTPPTIASVQLAPTQATIGLSEARMLVASPRTADGVSFDGCVATTWSSSAPSIASVDTTGIVVGVEDGSATITAAAGGQQATSAVTVGAGAGTGIRLNITSPVGASRYYAYVTGGGLATPVLERFNVSYARVATVDVPLPAAAGYTVRVLAVDSLSLLPDTLPVVAAGMRATNLTVTNGQRTVVPATLEAITYVGTVPATVPAGDPFDAQVTLTDPSGLFYDVFTFTNMYRGYTNFTADRQLPSVQLTTMEVLSSVSKRFTGQPFRPTQTGTLYSQYGGGVNIGGGRVIFWVFSPAVQLGQQPNQTTVTAATTGLRVNITAPAGVTRFIVGVDTVGGATAWGTFTGTGLTSGTVEVPVSAGTNYRVRAVAVQDFGFSPIVFATSAGLRSGGVLTGQTVTAGAFTEVNMTLVAHSATLTMPTSGTSGVTTPFNGTLRDPSLFTVNSACLLRYSTTAPITGAALGTLSLNACTFSARQPDGTFTAAGALPAITGPDTLYSQLFSSTIVYTPAGDRIELLQQVPGTTVIPASVTTGLRLNVTSPVGSSRIHVYVTGGGLTNQLFKYATGFARQQTITIPLTAATGATVRIMAADSLASSPDLTPILAAGYRLTGVNIVAGQITELNAPLEPIVVTYDIASAGSVGAPLTASLTIDDPSYILAPVSTWGNVFVSNTPPTADRTGSSVQLTDVEVLSPTSKRFTGTVVSPLDPATFYTQAGFGTGFGFGTVYWAQTNSLQRGESARVTTVTTPPNLATLNVTANANTAHNIYMVAVDAGPGTPAVLKSVAVTSTNSTMISVPIAAAGTYRVRVSALDSSLVVSPTRLSAEMKEGAFIQGVVVASGATVNVTVALTTASSAVVMPGTGFVGSGVQYGGTARDPGLMHEGEICIARFTDTGVLYGSGGTGTISQGCFTSNRKADGTRTINGALPAANAPVTRSAQVIMSRAYLLPNGQVIESNQFSPVTSIVISAVPTTGLRVAITSPVGASRYYAYVSGGALGAPQLTKLQTNFLRSATMTIPVPAGTGYRVRLMAADSLSASPDAVPLLAAGLNIENLTVTDGALTDVPATLLATSITAPVPTTATAGVPFPISVTLVDPSRLIVENATWAIAYASYSNITADRSVGSQLITDFTVDSPTQRTYTGDYVPSQSGTLRSQFGFGITVSGVSFFILSPSIQRGELPNVTTVAASTSGVRVQITSATPVNKFLVIVDAGPDSPQVIKDISGVGMTSAEVELPAQAFAGLRVRVAALDSVTMLSATRILATLRGGGMVEGVTVTAGNFTNVPVTLTANSKNVTVTPTAVAGQNLVVGGTFTDPSRITSEAGACAVRYSDTGPIGPGALGTLAFTCSATNPQPDGTFSLSGTILGRATAGTRHWLVLSNPGFLNQSGLTVEIDQAQGGSSTFTAAP